MHYNKGNPWKVPSMCIVWFPPNGFFVMTPGKSGIFVAKKTSGDFLNLGFFALEICQGSGSDDVWYFNLWILRVHYLDVPDKKLGSMVRINGLFHLLINGVYWGYNPLILTFGPNFLGHPSKVQSVLRFLKMRRARDLYPSSLEPKKMHKFFKEWGRLKENGPKGSSYKWGEMKL